MKKNLNFKINLRSFIRSDHSLDYFYISEMKTNWIRKIYNSNSSEIASSLFVTLTGSIAKDIPFINPNIREIAKRLKVSNRTVSEGLKILVDLGFLYRVNRTTYEMHPACLLYSNKFKTLDIYLKYDSVIFHGNEKLILEQLAAWKEKDEAYEFFKLDDPDPETGIVPFCGWNPNPPLISDEELADSF